jgi:hypothetical protein
VPRPEPSLTDILARLDKWLAAKPTRAGYLAPPANDAALTKAEKALGVKLPASFRALYKWHDGETESSPLFETMCRDDHATEWETYSTGELEIVLMKLDDVAAAGVFEGIFDEDTGECLRLEGKAPAGAATTKLVPFLWMRSREREEGEGPLDDDWLVAIDTLHEAVWMFEIANEGLEGIFEEAHSLSVWLDAHIRKLEKGLVQVEEPEGPQSARNAKPPSELLIHFLLDRKLVELAEGAEIPTIAKRLAPLLGVKPEKRAVKEVISFFEDDDDVEELFADDEMLRAIVTEFLD